MYENIAPKKFNWTPSIYCENQFENIAILLRRSANVPDFFLQRMAEVIPTKNSMRIYVVSMLSPSKTEIEMISMYGLGVAFIKNGRLVILKKSTDFSKKKPKLTTKKLSINRVALYPSSKQNIEERLMIGQITEELWNTLHVPIYVDYLEKNNSGKNFSTIKKEMDRGIDKCNLFVAILTGEHSKNVEYEIRYFLENYPRRHRFFFKKNGIVIDKKQKSLIEYIKKKDIKYAEYLNAQDFATLFRRELLKKYKKCIPDE